MFKPKLEPAVSPMQRHEELASDTLEMDLAPNSQLSICKNWPDLVNHVLNDCGTANVESIFIGTSLRFYRIA